MDDANELIEIARETGQLGTVYRYVPNATQCATRADVEESHFEGDQQVVYKIDNIYGMITLLSIGLGGATFVAMAELIVYKVGTMMIAPNIVIEI